MAAHSAATAERRARRAGSLTNCVGIQRCPSPKLKRERNCYSAELEFSADRVSGHDLPRLPEDPWELAGIVQEFAIGLDEATQARHGCIDDPVESVYQPLDRHAEPGIDILVPHLAVGRPQQNVANDLTIEPVKLTCVSVALGQPMERRVFRRRALRQSRGLRRIIPKLTCCRLPGSSEQ